MSNYKIALAHDFLAEYGGAERVVESLHQLFPSAPLYVAFADLTHFGSHRDAFAKMKIHSTWMQHLPFVAKIRSPLRIFAPSAFAHLNLRGYDVVISSSNAYHAKSVKVPNGVHLCYCHTPPRSLYGYDAASTWKKNPLVKFGGQIINHFLRQTDFLAAQKIDQIIVNSRTTAARVKKYWRRDSLVIYPPVALVDPRRQILPAADRSYFLFVNRLNHAKHPEIAVQACLDLHLPLKVVGAGPLSAHLRQMTAAAPQSKIEFLGSVSDSQLSDLYAHAAAVLYPVIDEDFGIVPVEAMSFGTPVIAHRSGGPTETITDGVTGILFSDLTTGGLKKAIQVFQKTKFNYQKIAATTAKFSEKEFQRQILALVERSVQAKKTS